MNMKKIKIIAIILIVAFTSIYSYDHFTAEEQVKPKQKRGGGGKGGRNVRI